MHISGKAPEKAGALSGMAGGSGLFDFDEKRVLIAVVENFPYALNVAGSLALLPKLPARAAPIPGEAAFNGFPERGGVHVRYHQNLVGFPVLNDRGDQALVVVFQVIGNQHKGIFIITRRKSPDDFLRGRQLYLRRITNLVKSPLVISSKTTGSSSVFMAKATMPLLSSSANIVSVCPVLS